jgi:alkylated DNA nucleotide flippase Atl1
LKLDRIAPSSHELRIAGIVARIRQIPKGSVRTYGEIDPEAPRLVGRVLATTREKLPWQRVIRADGSIPKGQRQRALLLGEGVPMRDERVDLVRARLKLPAEVAAYMRAASKYRYTVKLRGGQRVANDGYVARVRLTGNFPGRTADLRYRFTLRQGLISCLQIAP